MTTQDKITHIVINSELLLNRLQDSVAEKMFKQALKNKAKKFIEELKTVERDWYDKFFDQKEDSTCDVYDVYSDFINEIATVPIYDMENIIHIIKAYRKDPKSIEGIVNKINR